MLKIRERLGEIMRPSIAKVIGAGLGLTSLFLPWLGRVPNIYVNPPPIGSFFDGSGHYLYHSFPYATEYSFFDLMNLNSSIRACLIVFLAGTMLSFLTKLGGLLQALGLLGFGVEFGDFLTNWRIQSLPYHTDQFEFYLSAGCLLAAVSVFVVLLSGRRALESPACGCVPCSARVSAMLPYSTRIRT